MSLLLLLHWLLTLSPSSSKLYMWRIRLHRFEALTIRMDYADELEEDSAAVGRADGLAIAIAASVASLYHIRG